MVRLRALAIKIFIDCNKDYATTHPLRSSARLHGVGQGHSSWYDPDTYLVRLMT